MSFANVTCGGAAATDLRQTFKGEPPQLEALRRDTHVVFLSIGTSDIDFAGYGTLCVAADRGDPPSQDGNQVASALDATLRRTARQAGARFVSPYVDSVDPHPSFAGYALCQAGEPFYRGFDALAPGQEGVEAVLHLNKAGQTALADLILRELHG